MHFYGVLNLLIYPKLLTNPNHIKTLIHQLSSKGDERAFEQIYDLFYSKMYATAFQYLKNKPLAEEVVSDVFCRIWKKRMDLDQVKNFESYVFISVRNLSLNYIRNNSRNVNESFDEQSYHISDPIPLPDEVMQAHELQDVLNKSVESLPQKCRAIFKMIRFDGLKYKEVASELNISVNTVDTQMRIAMKRISQTLGDFSRKKK